MYMQNIRRFIFIWTCMFGTGVMFAQNTFKYENPNSNDKVKVQADTILYKYQYEPILQELFSLKRENDTIQLHAHSLEDRISQLEAEDFDKFLNLQDTTIFGSKFQVLSLDLIPKRSMDFYILIQDIHDLNELLTVIENMNISQLHTIGKQLHVAKQKIDEINSFAEIEKRRITDYLSEEQKQFFRDLVKRYNELYSSLNRN